MDPQKRITQYTYDVWKVERGLPNNNVFAIAQDRLGYLWLGTMEGLVRFDGSRFVAFSSRNTAVFHDDFINNLCVDRQGTLWIGTYRGQVITLERGSFQNRTLPHAVSNMRFNCLAEDGRGTLWIGTSAGLFHCPADRRRAIEREKTFADGKIHCLLIDRSGRLMVSVAGKGVHRLEKNGFQPVRFDGKVLNQDITVLGKNRNGSLWLGTATGLYLHRNKRLIHYPLKTGAASIIIALIEDRDGSVWVGTEGGLYRLRQESFEHLDARNGLNANDVRSLYEDSEGTLWAGTSNGGLIQLRDERVTMVTEREGLDGEIFRSLHEDDSGTLWIGGRGGFLSAYRNGQCRRYALPFRFKQTEIYSLEKGEDGALWLGTSRGILLFRNGRFREVSLPGPDAKAEVDCLFGDRSGDLWIGTYRSGLFCRRKGVIRRHTEAGADGFKKEWVTSCFEDRQGNLWVGSEGGVSVKAAGKSGFRRILDDCHVVSLYGDGEGAVWVGTYNQGLKVWKGGNWGSVNVGQGLFDSRVYALIEDDHGNLWMSSERGIFSVDKKELERAAFDPALKVRGRLFNENDGMKSRVCNYGNPSSWKDGRGRLWFGNIAGVVSIDPARIRGNDRVPPVAIEEVTIDSRRLTTAAGSMKNALELPAGSRRFEFTYTALSFIRSDKIQFKYRLDGYDREWVDAGNRRQAFYNDLRPGRYRFRVIAANADGFWNAAGASFAFRLRPFVYQTWWFLVAAALSFAAFSAFSWQLMKKYLRAVSFWKKRTQISHFRVLETIGTGGMATVYKAQDLLDRGRVVALKVLREENLLDENQRRRFEHESRITEKLDHPHIVRIIERGESEGQWYIAMELVKGIPLSRLIRERGRVSLADAVEIMGQVVEALGAIHGRNIVHRDLKPENIMIGERGERRLFVKLLDFGLAITPAQSRLTMSGVVMGTVRYLPPERIRDGISSAAGDIYSAGIILYEMLTGAKPFWSEATGEVIRRILETYPLPAREFNAAVPPELDALITAMIDKDPSRRPSLDAVEKELRRLAVLFAVDRT